VVQKAAVHVRDVALDDLNEKARKEIAILLAEGLTEDEALAKSPSAQKLLRQLERLDRATNSVDAFVGVLLSKRGLIEIDLAEHPRLAAAPAGLRKSSADVGPRGWDGWMPSHRVTLGGVVVTVWKYAPRRHRGRVNRPLAISGKR